MQIRKKENIISAKVFNEYTERTNHLEKENKNLLIQLNDIKTNLSINKEFLFKYLQPQKQTTWTSINENRSIIIEFKEENTQLIYKVESLFNEKREIEKKIYKMQLDTEKRQDDESEILKKADEDIFMLVNKIQEKTNVVENLKREVERAVCNSNLEASVKEVYIADPGRGNIELNNELYCTKVIINSITKMLKEHKSNNDKLQVTFNIFKKELEELKLKNGIVEENIGIEKIEIKNENKEESILESEDINYDNPDNTEFIEMQNNEENDSANQNDTEKDYLPIKVSMIPQKLKDDMLLLPKLDLKQIHVRYQSLSNIKIAKPAEHKYSISYNKLEKDVNEHPPINKKLSAEKELANKVIKAKIELENSNIHIKRLTKKLEKLKKIYKDLKLKNAKLLENLNIADSKIELLREQIRNVKNEIDSDRKKSYQNEHCLEHEQVNIFYLNKEICDHSSPDEDLDSLEEIKFKISDD